MNCYRVALWSPNGSLSIIVAGADEAEASERAGILATDLFRRKRVPWMLTGWGTKLRPEKGDPVPPNVTVGIPLFLHASGSDHRASSPLLR